MEIRGGFAGGEVLFSTSWSIEDEAIKVGEPKSTAAEAGITII